MCDGKEKTISIIESGYGNIFGGFISIPWQSRGNWKSDSEAWAFSLTHKTVHKLYKNQDKVVVYFNKDSLCTFSDFFIMKDSSKPE
jgi:aminopeptidase-like protein